MIIVYMLSNIQAEAKILRGPHEDLESYLEAVDQLRSNIRFFSSSRSLKASEAVLIHINGLLAKSILKLEEEFKQILSMYRSGYMLICATISLIKSLSARFIFYLRKFLC